MHGRGFLLEAAFRSRELERSNARIPTLYNNMYIAFFRYSSNNTGFLREIYISLDFRINFARYTSAFSYYICDWLLIKRSGGCLRANFRGEERHQFHLLLQQHQEKHVVARKRTERFDNFFFNCSIFILYLYLSSVRKWYTRGKICRLISSEFRCVTHVIFWRRGFWVLLWVTVGYGKHVRGKTPRIYVAMNEPWVERF